MRNVARRRYIVSLSATAALLTGCSGSQPPIRAPGAMPQTFSHGAYADRGTSWMLPEAKSDDLLYIATNGKDVIVLTYPRGDPVGTLSGFSQPSGVCTDTKGNVFIANTYADDIVEYAHGGTKAIATLHNVGGYPTGCAVDATTGDLAVAVQNSTIVVYKKARGVPAVYEDANIRAFYYCTYDTLGNLFAEGGNSRGAGVIDELSRVGGKLSELSLSTQINAGGGIQWDGRYLAVEDPRGKELRGTHGPTLVDQIKVSGARAKLANTFWLYGKNDRNPGFGTQFWIQGSRILSPMSRDGGVGMYRYPAGGHFVDSFKAGAPLGLAVSPAVH